MILSVHGPTARIRHRVTRPSNGASRTIPAGAVWFATVRGDRGSPDWLGVGRTAGPIVSAWAVPVAPSNAATIAKANLPPAMGEVYFAQRQKFQPLLIRLR